MRPGLTHHRASEFGVIVVGASASRPPSPCWHFPTAMVESGILRELSTVGIDPSFIRPRPKIFSPLAVCGGVRWEDSIATVLPQCKSHPARRLDIATLFHNQALEHPESYYNQVTWRFGISTNTRGSQDTQLMIPALPWPT